MDELSAFTQLYEEAVYIHDGEVYGGKTRCGPAGRLRPYGPVDYYTQAITERKVQVLHLDQQRTWGQSTLCYGEVGVSFSPTCSRRSSSTPGKHRLWQGPLALVTLETGAAG